MNPRPRSRASVRVSSGFATVTVRRTPPAIGSVRAVRNMVIRTSVERYELLARKLASHCEQFLLLHLAAIETVAKHAAAPRLDRTALYPLLQRANSSYDAFRRIGIADHTGRLVAADPPVTIAPRAVTGPPGSTGDGAERLTAPIDVQACHFRRGLTLFEVLEVAPAANSCGDRASQRWVDLNGQVLEIGVIGLNLEIGRIGLLCTDSRRSGESELRRL